MTKAVFLTPLPLGAVPPYRRAADAISCSPGGRPGIGRDAMSRYPHTIDNGHGEQLTFTGVVEDRLEAEGVAQPGAGAPMHVHYLQEEAVRVVSGRLGYQSPGEDERFAGPGQLVVWPPGTAHRWWNAGDTELRSTGWCRPPDNVEFFLGAVFASAKVNGGRPGLFDAAYLLTRYRREFTMLEIPAFVRRVILPVVYVAGLVFGRYGKYRGAPAPVSRDRGEAGRRG